jgi:predicted negative regulator of RcsB-dependent stress response
MPPKEKNMRALIVIVVLAVVLGYVGWVQFSSPDGDPTIRVDTEKVKQDTSAMVEKSKEIAGDAAKNIDAAAKKIDSSIDGEPAGNE